jgi:hypothetical protein
MGQGRIWILAGLKSDWVIQRFFSGLDVFFARSSWSGNCMRADTFSSGVISHNFAGFWLLAAGKFKTALVKGIILGSICAYLGQFLSMLQKQIF